MKRISQFARFWYDFVIGDDWRLALGVVATTVIAYAGAHNGFNWWWFAPLAIAFLLARSVQRASRVGTQ